MTRLMITVTVVAFVCAASTATFALGWSQAPERPAPIGQGWRDVCATVGPATPRPVAWQFVFAGDVVATGVCS